MANLMQLVKSRSAIGSRGVIRVSRTKADFDLSASSETCRKSERFYLVRLPVRKLPLLSAEASQEKGTIVIDTNSKRRKATASGFVPKVIVLKGLGSLQAAKANDKDFCDAWVGERALKRLNISAEDSVPIGANELQSKIQKLVSAKFKNNRSDKGDYSPSPWISEIYPFDNYAIYSYCGETYKQSYKYDSTSRDVTLAGEPVTVVVEYVGTQSKKMQGGSLADMLYGDTFIDKTMNQEMTLDKMNVDSPALGALAFAPPIVPDGTVYPAGSELARPDLRTMLNVREALSIYLSVLKDGMRGKGPLPNLFSPVVVPTDRFYINACREAEIAAKDAHRKIDIPSFINWQHATLTKKGGQEKFGLSAGAYAYVSDITDISTWHLQCNTEEATRKSLKVVMSCSSIPASKRAAIQMKLKALLKNQVRTRELKES